MNHRKISIVTDFFPAAGTDGRSAYLLDMITFFTNAGVEVQLINLSSTPNGSLPWYKLPADLLRITREVHSIGSLQFGAWLFGVSPVNWLKALPCLLFRRLPERLRKRFRQTFFGPGGGTRHFFISPGSTEFLQKNLDNFAPTLLLLNYSRLTFLLEELQLPEGIITGVITHDVAHKRAKSISEAGLTAYSGEIIEPGSEKSELERAEYIIAIQPRDAEEFHRLVPDKKVICAPISVGTGRPPLNNPSGHRCLLVGGLGEINVKSFQWFIDKIWPDVVKTVPDAELRICGNVCKELQTDDRSISLAGRIDSLEQEYRNASVAALPLLAGSGLKIKLIEALRYGCKCVSTSIGVQGIDSPEELGISVVDTQKLLASEIISALLEPESSELKRLRQDKVFEIYSPGQCYSEILELVNK